MKQNSEQIVAVVVKGKLYLAAYWVDEKGTITVSSILGRKSTQLGSMPALALAEMLLRELIWESR